MGEGWEMIRPQERACAKYKGLKHHGVLSNYKYFSTTGWRAREEGREAGESGSWVLGSLGYYLELGLGEPLKASV